MYRRPPGKLGAGGRSRRRVSKEIVPSRLGCPRKPKKASYCRAANYDMTIIAQEGERERVRVRSGIGFTRKASGYCQIRKQGSIESARACACVRACWNLLLRCPWSPGERIFHSLSATQELFHRSGNSTVAPCVKDGGRGRE
jgi:hypothetical protein